MIAAQSTPKALRQARALLVGATRPIGGIALAQQTVSLGGVAHQTALTAIRPFTALPDRLVGDQLAVAREPTPDATLICDAGQASTCGVLAEVFAEGSSVIDPAVVDAHGRPIGGRALREALRRLLPLAEVLVINAAEAAWLTGREVRDHAGLRDAGKRLFDQGARRVVLAGGRLEPHAVDLVYDGSDFVEFGADRRPGRPLGAGVIFAAALTAGRARGLAVLAAVEQAKAVVTAAIDGAVDGRAAPQAEAWRALKVTVPVIEIAPGG